MIIGIVSDTHNLLDPRLTEIFAGVEHIVHAGDVCRPGLVTELSAIAPVTVVRGNNDWHPDWRDMELRELNGCRFLVQHIVSPAHPTTAFLKLLERAKPHVVVFGHTHRSCFEEHDGVFYLNPGSAGPARFGLDRSVCRLDLSAPKLSPEFITLK
jgi:putative phosphoesterase